MFGLACMGLPSRPAASPNRRPEGPVIPQPRAQPWDCTRPPAGGLKVRVRLPFQGKGNVGGWIPRATPWAEECRAFGATRPISRRPGSAPRRCGCSSTPPRSGQPGGLGESSRGLSDPTGAIPPVARRRGSHPGRGAGTVAAVCDHRCRRVWVGHGGHRLPLQCAGLNGRSASTLLFVGGGRLRSVQACNSIPRPSPRPRVGPGMPK